MNIFLTGATGFLGGEILVTLSKRKEVDKVYCLVRAKSQADADTRLEKVFAVHEDIYDKSRFIAVIGNLSDETLADTLIANNTLKDITTVIHSAANTSFSKIFDDAVTDVNIGGLAHILKWSAQLKSLETFVYVGTATICGKEASNRIVMEEESPNMNASHVVKYTHTKMMGEKMLSEYLPEDKILVVRPSIIMGDSRAWAPRSTVILWALATVNLLRLVPVNGAAQLDIIPVDYVANAIVALLFVKRNHKVYHISSGKYGATSALQMTSAIAPYFTERPPFKFVDKSTVKQMTSWAKKHALKPDNELEKHPVYLNYWKTAFEDHGKLRILLYALDPYLEFMELGQVFDNSKLLADTGIESPPPAHKYITNSIEYHVNIDVFEGAMDA
jgi:thioester reductase-like protein